MTIVRYVHHGVEVAVQEQDKGKHREHCLCFQGCLNFKPGSEDNCPIAKENYEFCVKRSVCAPVFECPAYKAAPDA